MAKEREALHIAKTRETLRSCANWLGRVFIMPLFASLGLFPLVLERSVTLRNLSSLYLYVEFRYLPSGSSPDNVLGKSTPRPPYLFRGRNGSSLVAMGLFSLAPEPVARPRDLLSLGVLRRIYLFPTYITTSAIFWLVYTIAPPILFKEWALRFRRDLFR